MALQTALPSHSSRHTVLLSKLFPELLPNVVDLVELVHALSLRLRLFAQLQRQILHGVRRPHVVQQLHRRCKQRVHRARQIFLRGARLQVELHGGRIGRMGRG